MHLCSGGHGRRLQRFSGKRHRHNRHRHRQTRPQPQHASAPAACHPLRAVRCRCACSLAPPPPLPTPIDHHLLLLSHGCGASALLTPHPLQFAPLCKLCPCKTPLADLSKHYQTSNKFYFRRARDSARARSCKLRARGRDREQTLRLVVAQDVAACMEDATSA